MKEDASPRPEPDLRPGDSRNGRGIFTVPAEVVKRPGRRAPV